MSLKLKACGMKYTENINAIAQLDIDFMGFIFYPKSKRYVGENWDIHASISNIAHVEKVAVVVNESLLQIQNVAQKYDINTIQLHGDENIEFIKNVKSLGLTVIKAFQVDEHFDFEQLKPYQNHCDYFLFDTKSEQYGGSGHSFDWNILNKYRLATPFFLSGGIGVQQVAAIKQLNHPQLFAIDVNSRFEIEPALKDVNQVKAFKEELLN